MDLKNSSQHRHHQNSNGRTESVHLATPPLAPLKKKKKKVRKFPAELYCSIPGNTRDGKNNAQAAKTEHFQLPSALANTGS